MSTIKCFLSDASNNKTRVHQLDFTGAFIQANVKHRVLLNLDRIYGEYFPEYANYFGRPLILNKSMYGMNNHGEIFAYNITNWMIYE